MALRVGWFAIGAVGALAAIAALGPWSSSGSFTSSAAASAPSESSPDGAAFERAVATVAPIRVAEEPATRELARVAESAPTNQSGPATDSSRPTTNRSTVRGRVFQGDVALRGATVELLLQPAKGGELRKRGSAQTDKQGRFEIARVRPGEGRIQVRRSRRGECYEQPISVPPSAEIEVDLALPLGVKVVGRVLQAGVGLPNATVQVRLHNGPEGRTQTCGSPHSPHTDDAGGFAIEDVLPGNGFILVSRANSASRYSQAISVVGGGPTYVEVLLPADGAIVGRVRMGRDGRPLEGATVDAHLVKEEDPPEGTDVETDASGSYTMPRLKPGRYRVGVGTSRFLRLPGPLTAPGSDEELTAEEKTVDVGPGETVVVDFLLRRTGSVVVEVLKSDGTPAVGHEVSLHRPPLSFLTGLPEGTTDQRGLVRFDGLCARELVAIAVAPGKDIELTSLSFGSYSDHDRRVAVSSEPFVVEPAAEVRVRVRYEELLVLPVRVVSSEPLDRDLEIVVTASSGRRIVGLGGVEQRDTVGKLIVSRGKHTLRAETRRLSGEMEIEIGEKPPDEIVVRLTAKPPTSPR